MVRLTEAYRSAFKKLNDEQREAVTNIEGPLLVVAGPGTGKTQLLSTRIGYILETTDTLPENILCMTFSESAARNMRERLAKMIGPDAYDITVSTYHSFGSDLIRDNSELFGFPPDSTPADDLTIDRTIRAVCKKLDYFNALKPAFFTSDIKELIRGYKHAGILPDTLKAIYEANRHFIDAANNIVSEIFDGQTRINKGTIPLFSELLTKTRKLPENSVEGIIPLKNLWIEQLEAAVNLAEGKSTSPLTEWKNCWLVKDELDHYTLAAKKANDQQGAMAQIYAQYDEEFKRNGLYDYEDMIMQAIAGLEKHSDVKYTLQERYQYLLLDEFQDTNEAQLRLVELLTDNPVNEQRPNVLAVGDDDQAVYSFQGAHYSHMTRYLENYRAVKKVNLKINYRSTPGIIQVSQAIREQIVLNLNLGAKQQLSNDESAAEEILRVELPLDHEHLAWTAQYIENLINDGHDPNQICVLAPKHKYLQALIPYLRENKIPVSYEQRDNVLEDPNVCQVITMARLVTALIDKSDSADKFWSEVISYDFWQIPTETIWHISWQATEQRKSWSELLLSDAATRPVALFFIRLSQISLINPFEQVLGYILGSVPLDINQAELIQYRSPFYEHNFKQIAEQAEEIKLKEWQLLGHLSILRAKVREASEEMMTIKEFVAFIDAYRDAELKIIDSSPFRERAAAITLNTAYGSKGMEYQTVILIDACDEVWGKASSQRHSFIGLPLNLAHVRLNNTGDDEKLRLLFVAASRAKNRLLIVGYRTALSGKEMSYVKFFKEAPDGKTFTSPLLPKSAQIIQPSKTFDSVDKATPAWFDRHLAGANAELKALLENKLINFKLSATKLNKFSDVTRGGPRQFFLEEILKLPGTRDVSSAFGSAVHKTLDWQFKQFKQNGDNPDLESVIDEFTDQLKRHRLPKLDFTQLLKRGKFALSEYLINTEVSNNPDDLSEYKLEANLKDARLSGEIDRIIIDRKAKNIELIDFKTGKSYTRWTNDIKPYHHRRQLYFYKLLVELSPQFKGYNVSKGTIQFVEPSTEDGKVHSIGLYFQPEEEHQLRSLIEAAWELIQRVDFPETQDYAQSVSGIREFEKLITKSI